MTEINDYVRTVFFKEIPNVLIMPEGFRRNSELIEALQASIETSLHTYNADGATDTLELATAIKAELQSAGVIIQRTDPIAGSYYRYVPELLPPFRAQELKKNDLYLLSKEIGDNFFPDVFNAYFGRHNSDFESRLSLSVPASDRIVTIDDNQIRSFEEPIDEIVSKLEQDNGVPDAPGVKERLLGQIKAGRELLRAGNFRAYLLYATLIKALAELIERYKGHAIAMVAASLIDLLVKQAIQAA